MTYADECLERAEKTPKGPWVTGYVAGQCYIDHQHGGAICKYVYDIVSDNNEISHHSIIQKTTHHYVVNTTMEYGAMEKEVAAFIAHARTDVPELARRLMKACERLRNSGLYGPEDELADELEAMPEDAK